jgi:hypothetical protein
MKDADPNSTMGFPMARIRIPSRGVASYVRLMLGINPVIPPGTLLKIKRDGDVTNHLAQSKSTELDSGPDLGEQATVKVVRQAPGDDELYVAVMDGPLAGKKGWVATPLEYLVFDKSEIEVRP